jgi:hypothetical protein
MVSFPSGEETASDSAAAFPLNPGKLTTNNKLAIMKFRLHTMGYPKISFARRNTVPTISRSATHRSLGKYPWWCQAIPFLYAHLPENGV